MKHFNIDVDGDEYLTRENYLQKIHFDDSDKKQLYLDWYDKHISFF